VAANPTIFTRYIDTLVGQGQAVIRPTLSETFDFEGEIAIIIGRGGRHIPVETAPQPCQRLHLLYGWQRAGISAPFADGGEELLALGRDGPWIVPAQNVAPADPLLETRLNGEKVQGAHASQMIFDIPHAIAYCSRFTLLRPGDVIATGTPGGVGSRREPPLWMKAGDRIEVSAEGIGTLCNPVADEG
jgi:2-keto-4-pentenoate hydratase/2-oxohepta-3-ene-1,7-dioic acid hydratase in catechol pathway